jgi:epoxide hydrolase-like protein
VLAASGVGLPAATTGAPAENADGIRPFTIHVPEDTLVDLRRRLAATRWPENETVSDQSQGVQLETMTELVRYWQTDYSWRKAEAKLSALPQFMTTIDGSIEPCPPARSASSSDRSPTGSRGFRPPVRSC